MVWCPFPVFLETCLFIIFFFDFVLMFLRVIHFIYIRFLLVCLSVHHVCTVPTEGRRAWWILWNCSRQLWVTYVGIGRNSLCSWLLSRFFSSIHLFRERVSLSNPTYWGWPESQRDLSASWILEERNAMKDWFLHFFLSWGCRLGWVVKKFDALVEDPGRAPSTHNLQLLDLHLHLGARLGSPTRTTACRAFSRLISFLCLLSFRIFLLYISFLSGYFEYSFVNGPWFLKACNSPHRCTEGPQVEYLRDIWAPFWLWLDPFG